MPSRRAASEKLPPAASASRTDDQAVLETGNRDAAKLAAGSARCALAVTESAAMSARPSCWAGCVGGDLEQVLPGGCSALFHRAPARYTAQVLRSCARCQDWRAAT